MIDITYSKNQMFADVGATSQVLDHALHDPHDPRFLSSPIAALVLQGHTRDVLIEPMQGALKRRFAHIPSKQLRDELTYLVKKAMGNAFNWGHRHDESKTITVEMVVTDKGAVVTVSDEGDGFDVVETLTKFEQDVHYFNNHGTGFVRFVKTRSLISYSNGGRSFHLRFLCEAEPGQKLLPQDVADFGQAADVAYLNQFWKEVLTEATVTACQIYRPHKQLGSQRRLLYQLHVSEGDSWLLSGELLTTEQLQTAVSATQQLDTESIRAKTGIHILHPLTYLTNPTIAFYRFNPQRNLGKVVGKHKDFVGDTLPLMRQLGEALQHLHKSQITLTHFANMETSLQVLEPAFAQAKQTLAAHTPERLPTVAQLANQIKEGMGRLHDAAPVPIHGDLSWNTILYGDKQFYLHDFTSCHYGHPGFDLGGFLADLMRHYLEPDELDEAKHKKARAAFLEAYFGEKRPLWSADLSFFTAAALVLRLDRLLKRPHKKWERKVDPLLNYIHTLLTIPEPV